MMIKKLKALSLCMIVAVTFFRCQDNELIEPQLTTATLGADQVTQSVVLPQFQTGSIYYVASTGNDATGTGSSTKPWKTLKFAVSKVPSGLGHTIKLSAGTYVESGLIEIPAGVSVEGAGMSNTFIKAASTFHYNPANPGYATDKYLISLNGSNATDGRQVLKNFTIDGDLKKLHGGIYVRYRNNVIVDAVKIQNTNFNGIWLWDVKDAFIKNVQLVNCSWGSSGYSVGALNLGNLERVDIDHLDVNESKGYGVKAIGPSGYNNITSLKIHDSRVSVNPVGLWNDGSAPNIAIELWQVSLVGCEIYNTYVDNTISLVNSNNIPSTGKQTIRVHDNTIDMETRAKGEGYGVELTLHDAEIDHNYFIKGTQGIANWDNPVKNWSIHHNVFYGIQGIYPGEIVRSQWSGLHNVKLYNNTIEFIGTRTSNVVGLYGGASDNLDIKNNLVINSNTAYNFYQNQFIHSEGGATISVLTVSNNLLHNLSLGTLVGSVLGNLSLDPKITKTGSRPSPYYMPATGSPLINAGAITGFPYQGSAPDIGAFETGATPPANGTPLVSLTSPVSNSTFTTGASITVSASASDTDGSVSKVEFYNGATKLGEDASAPYGMTWSSVPTGTYSLTAKATDNSGAIKVSNAVSISVGSSAAYDQIALDASQATLSGTMAFATDAVAGTYFYIPSGKGKNYFIPPTSSARFAYQAAKTGTYNVWARVKSPSSNNQGYYIYAGNGRWFTWNAGIHTDWAWVKLTDASNGSSTFSLNQGSNELVFGWYDDNVKIDKIVITNNPAYIPN